MCKTMLLFLTAILALNCAVTEGFLMFPLKFDYTQSDQATKSLVYSSPLTGKTYNVDYRSNFGGWQPPPGPPPFPMNKMFKFDTNWLFNKGSYSHQPVRTTTPKPIVIPVHPFLKKWKWDGNWNFNKWAPHPGMQFTWDFNVNKGGNGDSTSQEASTEAAATEKTTTMPVANGGKTFHKQVDIKVSYGQPSSEKPAPPQDAEKPEEEAKEEEKEDATRDDAETEKKADADDDEIDIDPVVSEQK